MGSIIGCICCYCCLMALKPRYIEIIALIVSLVEIGFLIWGIVEIPWTDIKLGGKIVFGATCFFIVFSFIFTLILMCLRCGNKINTTKNGAGKCLCITMIVFDVLAEILIIIAEIIIFNNMYDKDDDYYYGYYDDYDYNRRRRYRKSIYSDAEWAAAIVSITAAEIGLAIHCYCASFLLKLIWVKTNKSYLKYTESNNPDNVFSRSINVFNSPEDTNHNELKFLGYDQNGHPIYSGNTQYFTQTHPPANNNPQKIIIKKEGDKK